jgi:hypothetical protein
MLGSATCTTVMSTISMNCANASNVNASHRRPERPASSAVDVLIGCPWFICILSASD